MSAREVRRGGAQGDGGPRGGREAVEEREEGIGEERGEDRPGEDRGEVRREANARAGHGDVATLLAGGGTGQRVHKRRCQVSICSCLRIRSCLRAATLVRIGGHARFGLRPSRCAHPGRALPAFFLPDVRRATSGPLRRLEGRNGPAVKALRGGSCVRRGVIKTSSAAVTRSRVGLVRASLAGLGPFPSGG